MAKVNLNDLLATGEPQVGLSNLAEGTYEGLIKAGSAMMEPKGNGKDGNRVKYQLIVTAPEELAKRIQGVRHDLSTQVGVNIFLGEIAKMGFEQPHSEEEIGECLVAMDDLPVEFWVGPKKDDFPPKVRINSVLEAETDNTDETVEAAATETVTPEAEPEGDEITTEEINAMELPELTALIKDNELKVTVSDDVAAMRVAVLAELGL